MNLLGQVVNHKMFGKGVITNLCENRITVSFVGSQKLFLFPDAIPQHLTLKNASIQKKIEKMNEEQEQKVNEKRRKNEEDDKYRSRIYTMKIPTKSQVAYNIPKDKIDSLEYVEAGCFLSGYMAGKPRNPSNVQPNSAIILTDCATENEDERTIIGIAMAHEKFWGEDCRDGIIKLHEKHKMILSDENKISFWKYFKRQAFPVRWGRVPFKYFQNQTMEKILIDICQKTAGTVQGDAATDIYHYFCTINRISEKRIIHEEIRE